MTHKGALYYPYLDIVDFQSTAIGGDQRRGQLNFFSELPPFATVWLCALNLQDRAVTGAQNKILTI